MSEETSEDAVQADDGFALPGCLKGAFACVVLFGLPWLFLFLNFSVVVAYGAGSEALPVLLAWSVLLVGGIVLFARGLTRESLAEHGLVFFASTIIVVAVGVVLG